MRGKRERERERKKKELSWLFYKIRDSYSNSKKKLRRLRNAKFISDDQSLNRVWSKSEQITHTVIHFKVGFSPMILVKKLRIRNSFFLIILKIVYIHNVFLFWIKFYRWFIGTDFLFFLQNDKTHKFNNPMAYLMSKLHTEFYIIKKKKIKTHRHLLHFIDLHCKFYKRESSSLIFEFRIRRRREKKKLKMRKVIHTIGLEKVGLKFGFSIEI